MVLSTVPVPFRLPFRTFRIGVPVFTCVVFWLTTVASNKAEQRRCSFRMDGTQPFPFLVSRSDSDGYTGQLHLRVFWID
jgi:hypothetical protein